MIRCSGAYAFVKSIASSSSFRTIMRLCSNAFSVISLRDNFDNCSWIALITGATIPSQEVTNMAWLSAPVFSLRKEICGNKVRISRFVCNYFHFRRACGHIDCNIFQTYKLFGCCYILISGTKYFINLGNRLHSVCHSGNSLYSSGFKYFY